MENKTSAINIQVDSNVKKEATDVLTELGLSMSSAISASIFFELFQMAETLWDIPVSINFSADNMMRVNGVFSS